MNPLRAVAINATDYGSTLIEHNSNTHLYGNSSLIFSTGIKASSAKAIATAGAAPATGSYNATTHIIINKPVIKPTHKPNRPVVKPTHRPNVNIKTNVNRNKVNIKTNKSNNSNKTRVNIKRKPR